MPYIFRFDCYNEIDNTELDKYDRKIQEVRVAVVADTATEAEDFATKLITRQHYDLQSIIELTNLHPTER